jgi:hypothetical protein
MWLTLRSTSRGRKVADVSVTWDPRTPPAVPLPATSVIATVTKPSRVSAPNRCDFLCGLADSRELAHEPADLRTTERKNC